MTVPLNPPKRDLQAEGPRAPSSTASSDAQGDAQQLARHWAQGLFQRRVDFVWSALRGLGVPVAQVDDAVQEVFIVAYRRHEDFQKDSSERAWLYQVARNVAYNQHRTRRRKGGHLPLDEGSHAASASGPEDAAVHSQATSVLLRFLETLEVSRRDVFVLIELLEMTAPEAAQALDVKLNTVYSRLRLAREQWAHAVAAAAEKASR